MLPLTLFQEGPHQILFFQEIQNSASKIADLINYSRYCQVPLLTYVFTSNYFLFH